MVGRVDRSTTAREQHRIGRLRIARGVIQAPKLEPRIMRYNLVTRVCLVVADIVEKLGK